MASISSSVTVASSRFGILIFQADVVDARSGAVLCDGAIAGQQKSCQCVALTNRVFAQHGRVAGNRGRGVGARLPVSISNVILTC